MENQHPIKAITDLQETLDKKANKNELSNLATKDEVNAKASISDMTNYIEAHKDELKGEQGEKGDDGKDGTNGKDGYTPVKGVDYFDGAKGDKGDKGDTGADGNTPIKGIDYYTEADKQDIINSVVEALPKYNGGVS
jgi:hypothetical protein